jgi:hypothetical protein
VGKSTVAERVAQWPHGKLLRLERRKLSELVIRRVRHGAWSRSVVAAEGLVLDGFEQLQSRPEFVRLLVDLTQVRSEAGLRTVLVDGCDDGSVPALMDALDPGVVAVLLLRFPNGPSGKLRYARRRALELGLPVGAALGTEHIADWSYQRVEAVLMAAAAAQMVERDSPVQLSLFHNS